MNAKQDGRLDPMFLGAITRDAVRRLVEGDSTYLHQALSEGKNIHQVTLDRQDQINAYTATLSESDALTFLTLYEEEMRASTSALLDQTSALNAATAAKQIENITQASQVGTWISLVTFFVFVIILISIYK